MKTKSIFKTLNFQFTSFAFLAIVLPMLIALGLTGVKLRNDYRKTKLDEFAFDIKTKINDSKKLLDLATGGVRMLALHFEDDLRSFPEQIEGLNKGLPHPEFQKGDLYQDLVADIKQELSGSDYYLQGRIINVSGQEIARLDRTDSGLVEAPFGKLQDKSHRDFFKHITEVEEKSVHVMPVSLNREHGKLSLPHTPMIRIGRKIVCEDGTLFGIVVLNVHTDLIFHFPTEKGRGFLIIDEEGTYLHHWNEKLLFGKDLGHPSNLLAEEPELRVNLGRQDSRIHYDSELKEYRVWEKFFYHYPVDHSRYWLFMERHSEDSIVSPWTSIAQKGLFSLAVILVMGFLIFTWFLRKNLSPMKELHNGIEELKMGNLMARVPVKSQTEIGEVAAAFNSMAKNIETTYWEMRKAMSLTHAIGKIAPNAQIITDMQGLIISVNPATGKIFGYEAKELVGQNVKILMPSPHKEKHDEYLRNYLKTGTGNVMGKTVEVEGLRKNGRRFPMSLYVGESKVVGDRVFIGILEDITDRKKMVNKLAQANEEIKAFANIVSHDLRSPLVNIKGFSSELQNACRELKEILRKSANTLEDGPREQMEELLKDDIPEALDFIGSSTSTMERLISHILNFSRLGRRLLQKEKIETATLVEEKLKTFHHQIQSRGIKVKTAELPSVVADESALEQIFGNILSNAINYLDSNRPGTIEISGETNDHHTLFRVKDNGRGIAKEDNHKVFEIFRRAGRQDVSGEGMGLPYVKVLVERHGGELCFESEEGVGTTFYFTISNEA